MNNRSSCPIIAYQVENMNQYLHMSCSKNVKWHPMMVLNGQLIQGQLTHWIESLNL